MDDVDKTADLVSDSVSKENESITPSENEAVNILNEGSKTEVVVNSSNVVEYSGGICDEIAYIKSRYADKVEKLRQAYKDERDKRDTAEYKLSVASEQRILLIKEVKNLQLEVDEHNFVNDKLCGVNEEMEIVIEKLRRELELQVKIAKKEIANPEEPPAVTQEAGETEIVCNADSDSTEADTEQVDQSEPSSIDVALEAAENILHQSREVRGQHTLPENPLDVSQSDQQQLPISTPQHVASALPSSSTCESSGLAACSSGGRPAGSTQASSNGRRRFSVSSLLNVDSLTMSDIKERMQMLGGSGNDTTDGIGGADGSVADDNLPGEQQTLLSSILSSAGGGGGMGKGRKASIKLFTDMFSKDAAADESSDSGEEQALNGASVPDVTSSSGHISTAMDRKGSETSATMTTKPCDAKGISRGHVPLCHRCGGTVEGPKYSTCRCTVPLMTPDEDIPQGGGDMHQKLDHFKSMINKKLHASPLAMKLTGGNKKHNGDNESENQLPVLFDPNAEY